MSGGIYLIQDNGQLVEMKETPYNSEALLQELLENYPNLLAGDQINSSVPRKWLLVKREMEVPSEEDGAGRWLLDHLFLDQDGIPTLVEVKRSSDTRIRREVVGQMLDYAANGVVYWPVEKIIAQFEANCQIKGENYEEILSEFLGIDADVNQFWEKVKTNLLAGKVRLLFVADEIPPELRRIVEFLNTQMNPAEVLAVEIKQYTGNNLRSLVPRVIGQTGDVKNPKVAAEKRQWDEESFFQALEAKRGADENRVARKLFEWANRNAYIQWGTGSIDGSLKAKLGKKERSIFLIWTNGEIFVDIANDYQTICLQLQERLDYFVIKKFSGYFVMHLSRFRDESDLTQFTNTFEWLIQELKKDRVYED